MSPLPTAQGDTFGPCCLPTCWIRTDLSASDPSLSAPNTFPALAQPLLPLTSLGFSSLLFASLRAFPPFLKNFPTLPETQRSSVEADVSRKPLLQLTILTSVSRSRFAIITVAELGKKFGRNASPQLPLGSIQDLREDTGSFGTSAWSFVPLPLFPSRDRREVPCDRRYARSAALSCISRIAHPTFPNHGTSVVGAIASTPQTLETSSWTVLAA